MCGRCDGEPYRGVTALFNGDFQQAIDHSDRADWLVVSPNVIVHLGKTSLQPTDNYLVRDCDDGYFGILTAEERTQIEATALELARPARVTG